MDYQYSYLIGDLVLLVVWLALFLLRRDVRKEMFIISLIFGITGPLAELFYTVDWWHPQTITGSLVGIEDFLFGFAVGGIASAAYEEVFKKKIRTRKVSSHRKYIENKHFFGLLLAGLSIFLVSFYILKMGSFHSTNISLLLTTAYIWVKRRDLILDSLGSGIFLMIVSFLAFNIPELITPGWVQSAWYLNNLTGIIILGAPLEDLIWFFLAGAFIGPLYEFWREAKLIKSKR